MNLKLIHADEHPSCSWARSTGNPTPKTKRKIIGKLFIDVFQKYADQIEGAEFLGPRHALPGCDRKRQLLWRPVGDDQVAPQCGRLA